LTQAFSARQTKAGTLLKRQIAIRTFADGTDARPGFFEMDLVADCGWSVAGPFLYALRMVNVTTGWIACAGLCDKRQETVFRGGLAAPTIARAQG
jgi:hypothetical protein